jgi:hypothetical protein
MGRLLGAFKWGGFILSLAALGVALAWMGDLMRPVRKGNVEDFWTGVWGMPRREGDYRYSTHVLTSGKVYIYHDMGIEGVGLWSVSRNEVISLFPQMLDRLVANPADLSIGQIAALLGHVVSTKDEGIKEVAASKEAIGKSAERMEAFLEASRWEELRDLITKCGPPMYGQYAFDARWFGARLDRAQWYWMTIAFEGVFLAGMLTLFWLPLLWRRMRRWLPAVWGGLPLLILFPYFLGYCRAALGGMNPGLWGGLLYPWIIVSVRPLANSISTLDANLLDYFPRVLEFLNQPPTTNLEEECTSFFLSRIGPVVPLIFCLVNTAILYGIQRVLAAGRPKHAE